MAKAPRAVHRGKSSSEDRAKKIRGGVKVNFSGVEGRVLLPEGTYRVKIEGVEQKPGNEYPTLSWKLKTVVPSKPKLDGKTLYYNTSLAPQSLWNLRNLLETVGAEVPDGPHDIIFEELIDEEMMVRVDHEEYEGKDYARVKDFSPVSGDEDDDEDDDDDVEVEDSRSRRKAKAKTKAKTRGRKKDEDEDEESEDGEDDDSDSDDSDTYTAADVSAMNVKELQKVCKDADLDVDLKEHSTLRKKQNAVIDALEEAGLIEDE